MTGAYSKMFIRVLLVMEREKKHVAPKSLSRSKKEIIVGYSGNGLQYSTLTLSCLLFFMPTTSELSSCAWKNLFIFLGPITLGRTHYSRD